MFYSIFFSSRRRHTRYWRDWSSDVCSSDLLESYIPSVLAHAFHSIIALSVTDVRNGEPLCDALESGSCVVADAACDADLEALVRAAPDPSSILWVGSAGLARALGEIYPGPRNDVPPGAFAPASGVLAVVGGINEVAPG